VAGLDAARKIEEFLDQLAPHVSAVGHERCFVHNDVHDMNVMCTRAGDLLAPIDWMAERVGFVPAIRSAINYVGVI